jgi:hypothetical protein
MLLQGAKGKRSAYVADDLEFPPIKEVSKKSVVVKLPVPVVPTKPGEPAFKLVNVKGVRQTVELGALRRLVNEYVASESSGNLASTAAMPRSEPSSKK